MNKLLAAAGFGLILATTSAIAAPAAKPANSQPSPAAEQRYCLKLDRATGSNINWSGCRTKAEWKRLGIDIDDLVQN
jgi:hypothetical protein